MLRWLVILLVLVAASPLYAQGGKLSGLRHEIHDAPSPEPSSDDDDHDDHDDSCHTHRHHCDCDDDVAGQIIGDLFGEAIGMGLLLGVSSPVLVPCAFCGDSYEHTAEFPRYPYCQGHEGHIYFGRTIEGEPTPEPEHLRWWSARFSVEEANDFDGLNRVGGQVVVDTASRFGVRFRLDWFHEELAGGRLTDETFHTVTNFTFRFAQHEMMQWYAGVGVRTLHDLHVGNAGLNFTYGVDIFIGEPLVWSSSIDAGWLGESGVVHIRSTLGYFVHGFEIFAGYDYLNVGSVSLQGPLVGLRLWF